MFILVVVESAIYHIWLEMTLYVVVTYDLYFVYAIITIPPDSPVYYNKSI